MPTKMKKKLQLNHQEYMNCIADNIASNNTTSPKQIHPPDSLALYHMDSFIPQSFPTYIRQKCFIENTRKYLCKKYKWSIETYKTIDWKTQQTSIKNMTYHRQRQCKKYIHNFLPIGKLNFKMQKNAHSAIKMNQT